MSNNGISDIYFILTRILLGQIKLNVLQISFELSKNKILFLIQVLENTIFDENIIELIKSGIGKKKRGLDIFFNIEYLDKETFNNRDFGKLDVLFFQRYPLK